MGVATQWLALLMQPVLNNKLRLYRGGNKQHNKNSGHRIARLSIRVPVLS